MPPSQYPVEISRKMHRNRGQTEEKSSPYVEGTVLVEDPLNVSFMGNNETMFERKVIFPYIKHWR